MDPIQLRFVSYHFEQYEDMNVDYDRVLVSHQWLMYDQRLYEYELLNLLFLQRLLLLNVRSALLLITPIDRKEGVVW